MADKKTESPELVNLREKETNLVDKLKRLEGIDANKQLRQGIDINEAKRRTQKQLAEIRTEIGILVQKEK